MKNIIGISNFDKLKTLIMFSNLVALNQGSIMNRILSRIIQKSYIEHLLFGLLALLSLFFFEERLYSDSSYYIGRVLMHDSFWVEHNRFVLILSQWLPLIGIKIGLGIKSILILYSLGNIIFFYSVFLICKYYYNNNSSGIIILLLQTLAIVSGFYVPMFELYYAAVLLILFSSILKSSDKFTNLIPLGILLVFIVTAHLFAVILLILVLSLDFTENRLKKWKHYFSIIIITGVIIYIKNLYISDYEQGKTDAFWRTLESADYNKEYLKNLVDFMAKYYKEVILLLIFIISLFLKEKKYLQATIIFICFFSTLTFLQAAYLGFHRSRYQEQVYFPLAFIVSYPLGIYFLNDSKKRITQIIYFGVVFIMIYRIGGICKRGDYYTQRVEEMKETIRKASENDGNKFIIYYDSFKNDANWSFPIETMLISSYKGPESTISIGTERDIKFMNNKKDLTPNKFMFRRWELLPLKELNTNYYNLDSTNYVFLDSVNFLPTKPY